MEIRCLGRTDLRVPVIGFGAGAINSLEIGVEEAVGILREAFNLGIRYFDTARVYGDSEEKVGVALRNVRGECVLATKLEPRSRDEAERSIRQSLRNLKTETLDIAQIHGVDDLDTLKKVMGPNGALEALKEAKAEGRVRFIGITGHIPYVLTQGIETGEFDTVLAPLNIFEREAAEELLPLAKKMNVGFIAMKPFLLHYDQRINIVRSGSEFKHFLGVEGIEGEKTLRYVLAHEVSTVIPGFKSIEEVRKAVKVAESFQGLTDEEKRNLQFGKFPSEPFCRECGLCMPCPEFIDIPTIFRFDKLFNYYGLKDYASQRYHHLSSKAYFCTKCEKCEISCPYNLPITKMLSEAEARLNKEHIKAINQNSS